MTAKQMTMNDGRSPNDSEANDRYDFRFMILDFRCGFHQKISSMQP